jgi:sugar/nucleoside kinase (ribokinase family)
MHQLTPIEPIDYLLIGHIARDLTPEGPRLGGTVTYSALTAQALGLRVGIVTSWGSELPLGPLQAIPIVNLASETSTTFENITTSSGRVQTVHNIAQKLDYYLIPDLWRNAPIVHLGPLVQEVEPSIVRQFSSSLIGLTPQGWLRAWDREGKVHLTEWPEAAFVLQYAGAAVVSLEDVKSNETRLQEMATYCKVLAVTEGARGVRIYWNGDVRRFPATDVEEVDTTGAGDIFATAFFVRLHTTRDPWESARFANLLASISVTRRGLEAIPTPEEIKECMIEVF